MLSIQFSFSQEKAIKPKALIGKWKYTYGGGSTVHDFKKDGSFSENVYKKDSIVKRYHGEWKLSNDTLYFSRVYYEGMDERLLMPVSPLKILKVTKREITVSNGKGSGSWKGVK